MANIQHWLEQIRRAIYGREVRSSIADAIEAINKEQSHLDGAFNQLIINAGNSNAEVVDARVKADGTQFNTLGQRLNKNDEDLLNLSNNFDDIRKEVIDARTDSKGVDHGNLKARLDNIDEQLDAIMQYNICDFPGGTLNEKWDNMRKQFIAWQPKQIVIGIPKANQEGAVLTTQGWKWAIDGPIIFDDKCNCSKILIYDEIVSITNVDSAIRFDDVDKPENIDFPYGVQIRGDSLNNKSIGVGLDIRAGSRINFIGQVIINDADYGVIVGGENQSSYASVAFDKINIGFPKECGFLTYGKNFDVSINANEITIQTFQQAQKDAVIMKGKIRSSEINTIYYITDVNKNGYITHDAGNVVSIYSENNETPRDIIIGAIYGNDADNGLKIYNPNNIGEFVSEVQINKIKTSNKAGNSTAYNIDYCKDVVINKIGEYNDAIIGSNVNFTRQNIINSSKAINDTGNKHVINNMLTRKDSVYTIPNTNLISVGTIVSNIHNNGNRIYIKYRNTGKTEDDIMQIDSQMFIPNIDKLPNPDWNLRGKMFMLWNTATDDGIYICLRRSNGAYAWREIITGTWA